MSMFDLTGRTTLVTGATQGIGLAIAQALTQHGARLILSDRNEAACMSVAQELQQAGHDVLPIAADLEHAELAQLARNLAVEWGPQGVRVNAVSPGLVRTPLAAQLMADDGFMKRRMQATPLRRVGEPPEIPAVVAMLASPAGGFITGQNLVVDGGTTISDGS
jgi:NAD(P)-dependent dehydrogenase (short-subunit alcohol dehydrogenase family)